MSITVRGWRSKRQGAGERKTTIGNRRGPRNSRPPSFPRPKPRDSESRDTRPIYYSWHPHRFPHTEVARSCLHPAFSRPTLPASDQSPPSRVPHAAQRPWTFPNWVLAFYCHCLKNQLRNRRHCGLVNIMSQDTGLFSIKRPREVYSLFLLSRKVV